MSKPRVCAVRWILALMAASISLGAARATEQTAGDSINLPRTRVVDEDLFTAGRSVQIGARVKGDVAAAGQEVTLAGPVQGYVLAAGANVNVTGPVGNDLWAAGANVSVSAPVADNAMLAGANVVLQPEASVGRDASVAGNQVDVHGPVGRNLKLAAADARLTSEVRGSVQAHVNHLILLPGAIIHGNLAVDSPNAPVISPQAKVLGRVDYHRTAAPQRGSERGSWVGWWLFRFLSLLILGAVFLSISRVWTDRVAATMARQPGLSAAAGIAGVIVVPVVSVLLMVTVIGIPLALLLLALYGVALLLAGVFVAYLTGSWLFKEMGHPEASPYACLAVGALIVALLMALPWIGWLFRFLALVAGFGALVVERWDFLSRLRAQGLA